MTRTKTAHECLPFLLGGSRNESQTACLDPDNKDATKVGSCVYVLIHYIYNLFVNYILFYSLSEFILRDSSQPVHYNERTPRNSTARLN